MLTTVILLVLCFAAGLLIELVDIITGKKVKLSAIFIAVLAGSSAAYASSLSYVAATVILSVIIACLFSKKVDNFAHFSALAAYLTILFIMKVNLFRISWIAFLVIFVAALIDEEINDLYDVHKIKNKIISIIARYRIIAEIAALVISIISKNIFYFSTLILFDIGYHISEHFRRAISKIL